MYASDLSDEEWRLIEHHFQRNDKRGAVPIHAKRDIVNAILYISKSGAPMADVAQGLSPLADGV